MKIFFNESIEHIDALTSQLFDFIDKAPNNTIADHIKNTLYTQKINEIRKECELPLIIHNLSLLQNSFKFPDIRAPKKEECTHNFEPLPIGENRQAILYCRHCAEIKRISLDEEAEQAKTKVYHIPIDEFTDICDATATFKELKELLIERQALQEGE